MLILLAVASLLAGSMNALAGGGSFITFPALLLTGLDARAANVTSTVALFPGQISTALSGRTLVQGAGRLSFAWLFGLSLVGGALGALLLLATPPQFFARLVPWLVLSATLVFTWGSFLRRPGPSPKPLAPWAAALMQFAIGIYGGYFGGGIGFLMLAVLTVAGTAVRNAGATKNALAATMNASAVAVFLFSADIAWLQAAIVAAASIVGGLAGAWALKRVNERLLRGVVVVWGVVLTIGLMIRG